LHVQYAIQFVTDRFRDLAQKIGSSVQDPDFQDLCADLHFVCEMEGEADGEARDRYSELRRELENELKSVLQTPNDQQNNPSKGRYNETNSYS